MDDLSREIYDLRIDIQTLHAVIDAALGRGVSGDDFMLRACANVLHKRQARLEELEREQLINDEAAEQ
jgi:hypothetical protein